MILRRLTLNPFAAGRDRSIEFAPGLTVILGPNEAGKSTISSALKTVLFARGPMTLTRFRSEIQPYLPVGLGDTVRVALEFSVSEKMYRLERTWVAPKNVSSRMKLEGGGELADEEEIQRIVGDALGFAQGTYENVLSVSQAQLLKTIDRLAEESDGTSGGFADTLRKSLYESDGVAVELLVERLQARIAEYFGRWDRSTNGPEKGRGPEARWEKGAGTIVTAWYDYRDAKKAFEQADAYEKKIDGYAAEERTLRLRCDEFQRRVTEFAPLVEDVRRRSELTVKVKECEHDVEELRAVLDQWPRAEAQLAAVTESITDLLSRHAVLKVELNEARERLRQESLRTKYANAESLYKRMKEEEQRLSELPPITEKQVESLKAEHASLQKLEIRISARKLAVRFSAKGTVEVNVKDGTKETPVRLSPGEDYSATVSGKLSMSHKDWTLDVWSSEENAETLERQQAESVQRLARLFQEAGVKTVEDAAALRRSVAEQSSRVKESGAALAAVLGNDSYESLLRQVQELPQTQPGRSEAMITDEIVEVRSSGEAKRREQDSLKEQCEGWVRKYRTRDDALTLFTTRSSDGQRLREALDQCRPIPQGFAHADEFLRAFDRAQSGLRESEKNLTDVEKARLDFEKHAPPQSREELEEVLALRKTDFERALRNGAAYQKIHEELQRLLRVLESNIFEPYHHRVQELLGVLTDHRHESLLMNGPLPERIGASDGQLALSQLSVGTLDVLAIAVRIAMGEVHLRADDGFLLLDDPMVNLDPARQEATARCLQEFSRRHQVIVFACHPSHADLLGGERVLLT